MKSSHEEEPFEKQPQFCEKNGLLVFQGLSPNSWGGGVSSNQLEVSFAK